MIGFWTNNIFSMRIVVKAPTRYVGEVPEAIPLRAALSIEKVGIIVGDVLCENLDVMLEALSCEGRYLWKM